MDLDPREMQAIFDQTVLVRKPSYGIIKGYHELPYVCIGEAIESGFRTTLVKGKVMVSPQFLITPEQYGPSYEDMFGADHVDQALTGRLFGFMGFRDKPVQCKSEYMQVEHVDASIDAVLSDELEELERKEDITAGVMICPNAQYYPISIEPLAKVLNLDNFGQKALV